eukprot:636144-Amorphochlora_amoeboformis.AAC.1
MSRSQNFYPSEKTLQVRIPDGLIRAQPKREGEEGERRERERGEEGERREREIWRRRKGMKV